MKCRIKKFKRITIALLTFSGLYVVFMVYKLGSFDADTIFGSGGGDAETAPKRVYWKQPYWIVEDDVMEGDYPVEREQPDGIRIYPYKGIKSEILSIRRTLRDTRPSECKLITYSYELMPVTIVIVFHNEYIGVILRSLYSIVTNTPKDLINEIIFVDDASDYLRDEFDEYLDKTRAVIKNIRILRLKERLGANRAILEAIKVAKSDHLVVMLQVLNVNRNWLPPLLNPLLKNPKTVLTPVHEYSHSKPNSSVVFDERGLFDLELKYNEARKLKEVSDATNFRTPLLSPRGLFVINKQFLQSINDGPVGGQDGNFIELSIKVWTCGGRIVKIPCSRVSHNFLESGRHDSFLHDSNQLDYELKSTIDNWFDEYKDIYLNISSSRFENTPTANTSVLRPTCKSFKWFLSKVAPDLKANYLTRPKVILSTKIQLAADDNLCLVPRSTVPSFLSLENCARQATNFDLTRVSDVRPDGNHFHCWTAYNEVSYGNVTARFVAMQPCAVTLRSQKFVYVEEDQSIQHLETDTCLEGSSKFVWLTECDTENENQKWLLI